MITIFRWQFSYYQFAFDVQLSSEKSERRLSCDIVEWLLSKPAPKPPWNCPHLYICIFEGDKVEEYMKCEILADLCFFRWSHVPPILHPPSSSLSKYNFFRGDLSKTIMKHYPCNDSTAIHPRHPGRGVKGKRWRSCRRRVISTRSNGEKVKQGSTPLFDQLSHKW